MALDTSSHVHQFLILQNKTEVELRAICEGAQLKTHGTKEELIDKLMKLEVQPQRTFLVPQAMPLRTQDDRAQPLDAAIAAIRNWRKLIFNQGGRKQFKLLNGEGKQYIATLKYINCSTETLQKIINEGWLLPIDANRDLIGMLKSDPECFQASIIQKPDAKGNSWLMLHVCPKSQAA